MKTYTKIAIYTLAALTCAAVAYSPAITGPVPHMRHLPLPKHTPAIKVTKPASLSVPLPKVTTLPEMVIKGKSVTRVTPAKAPKPTPAKSGQVCELHTLEQGGSPTAPFVLYCHN